MAGTRFKLEQVLNYRSEVEKIRKQEFASAKHAFEHASNRLKQQKEHVAHLSREFRARQGELSSIEEMRMYSDFFARKREDIKCQKHKVDQLDQVMSDQREHLMTASKDKKVLESLKDKNAKEFRLQMDHKEQAFLDEISIQKKDVVL